MEALHYFELMESSSSVKSPMKKRQRHFSLEDYAEENEINEVSSSYPQSLITDWNNPLVKNSGINPDYSGMNLEFENEYISTQLRWELEINLLVRIFSNNLLNYNLMCESI